MNYFFETIRCEDYEISHLEYHQKRVAKTIGLNLNLLEYLYPPTSELLRIKLIYTQEGIKSVTYHPYTPKKIERLKIVHNNEISYPMKYLNRDAIEMLSSKKGDAQEIVIVKDGLLTDTSIANIAIFKDNRWITPKKPLLAGTTRQRYLDLGKLYEGDITVEDLKQTSKVAVLNAMVGFKEFTPFYIVD